MTDYRRIPTTANVYGAIRGHHGELTVFSSHSVPEGDQFGDPSRSVMMTEWGFEGADFPTIGIRETWDVAKEEPYKNVRIEYWLCIGKKDD